MSALTQHWWVNARRTLQQALPAGRGWLFTLSRLHSLPTGLVHHYNIHGTIWFPPPNPSAEEKFSTEEAKQILCCYMKTCSCWLLSDEIPAVFINGDAAAPILDLLNVWGVPKSQNHLFFPNMSLLHKLMMLPGLWEHFCPRANVSQEFAPDTQGMDTGRSCWGLAVLRIHGHRGAKQATTIHGRAGSHGWDCLCSSRKKKKSGEKPLSSAEGIRIYCHIRWIQVNEKLRPDFISADNKTSASHN